MHKVVLGIEHLMTGAQFLTNEHKAAVFTVQRESSSTVALLCGEPFAVYWPVKQCHIESTEVIGYEAEKFSEGEVEWYAKEVAGKLIDMDNRSKFDMQTYTREANYPAKMPGEVSRYAPGEPSPYPWAVVKAMRRKFGKDADTWLAALRWAGDHWYFNKDGMYHGVEPDGYIHT